MSETIGKVAGEIWHILEANGEMTLAKLKKEVKAEAPLFDWAIGWLAREDKIVISQEKRSYLVSLKGWQSRATAA